MVLGEMQAVEARLVRCLDEFQPLVEKLRHGAVAVLDVVEQSNFHFFILTCTQHDEHRSGLPPAFIAFRSRMLSFIGLRRSDTLKISDWSHYESLTKSRKKGDSQRYSLVRYFKHSDIMNMQSMEQDKRNQRCGGTDCWPHPDHKGTDLLVRNLGSNVGCHQILGDAKTRSEGA